MKWVRGFAVLLEQNDVNLVKILGYILTMDKKISIYIEQQ